MDQTVQPAVDTHADAQPADMSDAALDAALRQEPETPAVAAETPTEAVKEPEVEKTVDLRALHEERMRRKNAEQEMRRISQENAQMRDNWTRAQARLEALAARQNEQAAPDPNTQPLEAMAHNQQLTAQQLKSMQERLDQQSRAQQEQQAAQQFHGAVAQAEAEFRQATPDYDEAVKFALSRRESEYRALGVPEQQIRQALTHEIRQVSWNAMQRGESPAQVAYQLAEAMGFMPAAKKLDMQAAGMKAAKPAGGAGGKSKPSLQALADMSPAEFDAATKGDAWKQMWS